MFCSISINLDFFFHTVFLLINLESHVLEREARGKKKKKPFHYVKSRVHIITVYVNFGNLTNLAFGRLLHCNVMLFPLLILEKKS